MCREKELIITLYMTYLYGSLWESMKKRHIFQYALINKDLDKHTLDQLRKNQNITILTVEKLCNILNCTPNDVFAFKDE